MESKIQCLQFTVFRDLEPHFHYDYVASKSSASIPPPKKKINAVLVVFVASGTSLLMMMMTRNGNKRIKSLR